MNQTLKNLAKAFVGESQARNRYTYYAKIAKKEGYEQIAAIFLETAEQEKTHAKRIFEHIQELKKSENLDKELNEIEIEAVVPTIYKDTIENLKAAISGENYEHTTMYPEFADIAEKEGYTKIAARLRSIAVGEKYHEGRYKKLLKELENSSIFKKQEKNIWVCRECGYVQEGEEPQEKCPSCDHPKSFYQVQCERY